MLTNPSAKTGFTDISGMTSCTGKFINQLGTKRIGDHVLHTEHVTLKLIGREG